MLVAQFVDLRDRDGMKFACLEDYRPSYVRVICVKKYTY